ncbi:MAG: glucose-6-phosphate isomerase [Bacillota bacterium]|mgnify:CR=1 FL=1|jgi:glucose-6-phosphate isomerase|nr:glucose-6-phosphate isomerase [Bacillota bacterium]HHU42812.1 glucose-6-phosphate isomerase [Clostridiales bacterium]
MKIRFDYNNMMKEYVGDEGISQSDLTKIRPIIQKAYDSVQNNRGKGMTQWMDLPYSQAEVVDEIMSFAKSVRKKFDNFVVLGIGGSALGPMAVFQALCHLRHNELPKSKRKAPKFYVEDNVDPERMTALLDVLKLEKTMFNVITKSGSTSETMSQYLIIMDLLKKAFGDKAKEHIVATTSQDKGNLIKIAKQEGLKTFYIPDGVGGRFSELCPVGLLPAAVLGINIKELLRGAASMDRRCKVKNYKRNPALMAAALQYICINKGKNISVMMPYADSLKLMADWYCQLWGESLGKAVDLDGNTVYVGQTPVKALGVTDQHSQVQLYTEGPFDKVITLVGVENYRSQVTISQGCEDFPDVSFLSGHTLNELIKAEMLATEYALTKNRRLNNLIMLPEVNAHTIGQLLMFFMMQTAYIGSMLNIDAFNQPGVEEGKNATYALLGRKGYEKKAEELQNKKQKSDKYII